MLVPSLASASSRLTRALRVLASSALRAFQVSSSFLTAAAFVSSSLALVDAVAASSALRVVFADSSLALVDAVAASSVLRFSSAVFSVASLAFRLVSCVFFFSARVGFRCLPFFSSFFSSVSHFVSSSFSFARRVDLVFSSVSRVVFWVASSLSHFF
jgi:hypothetical protein